MFACFITLIKVKQQQLKDYVWDLMCEIYRENIMFVIICEKWFKKVKNG